MSGNKMLGDGLNCAEHSREKEIANLKQQLADSQTRVKELEEQVKGMRCCGNCGREQYFDGGCKDYKISCTCFNASNWQPKEG